MREKRDKKSLPICHKKDSVWALADFYVLLVWLFRAFSSWCDCFAQALKSIDYRIFLDS